MIFIVINVLIAAIFVLLLKVNNNSFTYSMLFLLYWWFFCSIGYLLYHNDYDYYPEPFIWIGVCVAAIVVGHAAGSRVTMFDWSIGAREICEENIYSILILILMTTLTFDIISFIESDQFFKLFTPSGLLSILNSSEKVKASGEIVTGNSISKILGVAECFGTILYGFAYDSKKIGKSILLKILFVTQLVINVITSAGKFSIIAFVVLFTSGFITTKMRKEELRLKNINYTKLVAIAAAVGAILYFLMNNRAGRSVGMSGIMAYGFGEIPSFNYWYIEGLHENTHGVQSFYGVASHLVPEITFAEGYTNYPLAPVAPIVNIFTMFRAIISDFGKVGGLFIMSVMGFSAGMAQKNLDKNGLANGWMAMMLGVLLMGFLMPIGYYLTLLLGYLLFILFTSCCFTRELS